MSSDDFFDFMVFWELMFPEDENKTYECPSCNRVIRGNENVPWIDKKANIFKCPQCDELLQIDSHSGELIEIASEEVKK